MLRELTMLRARAAGARTADALPDIKLYAIDVSFERISDPKERSYFMNQPTSFVLPAESVDRLREIAGRLLRESTEFQALVQELGGVPAGASGTR
jgi:NTE family protein